MRRTIRLSLFTLLALQCLCFVPARGQGQPWKFLVFGDTRGNDTLNPANTEILTELAREVTNQRPAFVLVPGDLVYAGTLSAFQTWSNIMAPVYEAGISVYPVMGNHEYDGDPAAFPAFFGPGLPTNGPAGEIGRTYAVFCSNVVVLALDEYITPYEVNTNWIKAVLATNTCLHVFATGHMPAFKVFHPDCLEFVPDARDVFWNILSNAASRVYITAHDHFYDHLRADDGDGDPSNDIHQLIIGGGGAPIQPDGAFDGDNGGWTPTRVFHEEQYGYVTVEIDGPKATFTWYHRTGANSYAATSDVFSYTLAPVIVPGYSNGTLTLTWAGGGRLQSAPDPSGLWTTLTNGTSPCVITNLAESQTLYRVKLR